MSAISLADLEALEKQVKKATTTLPSPTTLPAMSGNSSISRGSIGPLRKIDPHATALERFESEVGGRDAVIESLELVTLDKKQQHLLNLLTDPRRERDSINRIAKEAGLTPLQVMDIFRSAAFAKAHATAMVKMADSLPAVVDDITSKSVDAKIECPMCQGDKELAGNVKCPQCNGKGTVMRYSDLDRQKIVLESTGVVKRGQGGVNVNVNQQVGVINPGSFFTKYVKDSDSAAYDVENIQDAEIVDLQK